MVLRKKVDTAQVIEDVVNKSSHDKVYIRDLMDVMDATGFGLTMIVFSLAILVPLPPPVPSIFAVPLIIFALQMVGGYTSPKLPKKLSNLSVKRSTLALIVRKSAPHLRKIEKILKPRFTFMLSPFFERIIGFFVLIFASSILLPIPLSNFIPGLGICIISFALLAKDGLVVMIGIFVGVIGVAITFITIFFGAEVLGYLKNLLF